MKHRDSEREAARKYACGGAVEKKKFGGSVKKPTGLIDTKIKAKRDTKTGKFARGGAINDDEDKKDFKLKRGGKVDDRDDDGFARGGAPKKKGAGVNIIIANAPKGGGMAPPMGATPPKPALPPGPGVGGPPSGGMAPGGSGPAGAGGLMGAMKRGGRIKAGAMSGVGRLEKR